MLLPVLPSAASCAALSMPQAMPETTVMPQEAKAPAICPARACPRGVALREPMTPRPDWPAEKDPPDSTQNRGVGQCTQQGRISGFMPLDDDSVQITDGIPFRPCRDPP